MKKIAFFDTKPYDRESFDRLNNGRYDIRYFETRLTAAALPLAKGCDAACAFVNAEIDRAVVEGLVSEGIKVLALRCAGYNNVDFKAAYEAGLTVVRVPASLNSIFVWPLPSRCRRMSFLMMMAKLPQVESNSAGMPNSCSSPSRSVKKPTVLR